MQREPLVPFNILNRPIFPAKYQVHILPHLNQVILLDEKDDAFVLNGKIYVSLAPFLKKGMNLDDVIEKLRKKFSLPDLFYALTRLDQRGWIEQDVKEISFSTALFGSLLGLSREKCHQKLNATPVWIKNLSSVPFSKISKAFQSAHIVIKEEADFSIVVTDDYLDPKIQTLLPSLNKKSWILSKLSGLQMWFGPFFAPEKEGMYEEMVLRLRLNLQDVLRQHGRFPSHPSIFNHLDVGLTFLVQEVLRWIFLKKCPDFEEKIQVYDSTSMQKSSHFLALPRRPKKRDSSSLPILKENSCEKTWTRFQHLISPITGIVQELKPISSEEDICHVYISSHAFLKEKSFVDRPFMNSSLVTSAGKGITKIQAKVSCLCEAIERYSGIFQGDEERKLAAFSDFHPNEVIHPNRLQNFSSSQQKNFQEQNQNAHYFHKIAKPFDEKARIEWSSVWSLNEKRAKWIPTAYCYYGVPNATQEMFCWGDSNGCAAGNSLEEAILQGFFELVERDSIAIWWYNRLQRPGVDLHQFQNPYFDQILHYYASKGRNLWVIDLTFDLNIPTFAAISKSMQEKGEKITLGFGSHWSAEIALSRALTEGNQLLAYLGMQADSSNHFLNKWMEEATALQHPFLLPDPKKALRVPDDYPFVKMQSSLDWCSKKMEEINTEILVLDQTREEIGFPVVKVFAPGLRHMWNRFGPGRLYEVPVKLGLLDRMLDETELNPTYMFL